MLFRCVAASYAVRPVFGLSKRAVFCGAALAVQLLAAADASAQCTSLVNGLDDLLPVAKGGTVGALVSVIDTANTAFLSGTTAFVGSPSSPTANAQAGGVWARGIVGTVDNDNKSATTGGNIATGGAPVAFPPGTIKCDTTTRQNFDGFQVGRDIAQLNLDNTGFNLHFGVTAGYFEADAKDISPGGTFRGNFQVPFAGSYAVLTKGSFFADGQVRFDYFDNEISDAANGLFAQEFNARSVSVTGNMGYRLDIPSKGGSKWFIEPSVGGVWSHTDVDPLNVAGTLLTGQNALPGTVQIDDVESLLGRASLRVGTNFTSGGLALQPFATASVFREFADGVTTTQKADFPAVCASFNNAPPCPLNGYQLDASLKTSRVGTYGQFGVGLAGQVIDTGWLGYARVDYRTGDNIEGVSGNIGLRYQWSPGPLAHSSLKDGPAPEVRGRFNWTGLYAGGFAGALQGEEDWRYVAIGSRVQPDFQGYLLGGQAGYNIQTGALVVGVEGDIGTSNAEGGKSCPNGFFFTCHSEVDTLASVSGRLGYAWERILLYAKAGAAFGEVSAGTTTNGGLPPNVDAKTQKWVTGWTAGGGAEFALAANWSAKGEWMYYDFGTQRYLADTSGFGLVDVDTHGQVVRVGVNYHLGH